VLELQCSKESKLLDSMWLREFVLQNCPYHSLTLQVCVSIRIESHALGSIIRHCDINLSAARHCGQWY